MMAKMYIILWKLQIFDQIILFKAQGENSILPFRTYFMNH